MTRAYRLLVETRGGVAALGRVVGVLALYELTPHRMRVEAAPSGLSIEMNLSGDPRACELCASRLSASAAVEKVRLSEAV